MANRLRFSTAAAYRHLRRVDPAVGRLIDQHGPYTPRPGDDAYEQLVRTILFQQLAGPAASAIMRRWYGFYGNGEETTPTPEQILATSDEDFRACGISRQKTSYFRDLAAHVVDDRLPLERLDELDDDAVITALTAVKGIGRWSAHMLLMFHLGRPDILPIDDLGVRKGMQAVYKLDETPTPKQAAEVGAHWAPWRSVASWYMWAAVETVTPD